VKDILTSLRRGAPRILVLAAIALAFFMVGFAPELFDARGGPWPVIVPIAEAFGRVFLGLALGDLALRILQPKVDPQQAAMAATDMLAPSMPPAIVYAARMGLAAVVLILAASAARAAAPPAAAVPLLPVLKAEQRAWWPGMPSPSALGGQVEQETGPCPSRSCWSPRAELRTSREQGVGLGQITRAFRVDGSTRFDAMQELKDAHRAELRDLSWQNRFDARLQLRALVLKDFDDFRVILGAATPADRLAMTLATYNGGRGGLARDRRVCAATAGCDKGRWFGHVERTSTKAKTAAKGYGLSFFEVNRSYVRNILMVRRLRYLELES
jgi:hypothetical protein